MMAPRREATCTRQQAAAEKRRRAGRSGGREGCLGDREGECIALRIKMTVSRNTYKSQWDATDLRAKLGVHPPCMLPRRDTPSLPECTT